MAKAKKKEELDDFTSDLIKSLNKERGSRVAYNLSTDESPTHVKRWISTGSKQLDYIISRIVYCRTDMPIKSRVRSLGNFYASGL